MSANLTAMAIESIANKMKEVCKNIFHLVIN